MNDTDAGKYWNENALTWTDLARKGYDIYRDVINTPAFFRTLPNIDGLFGLDIGCGEGYNTRKLARCGALVVGIDIAENFINQAIAHERNTKLNIDYYVASAHRLPFSNETFDFATGFMSFMDIPEMPRLFNEAFRVIKPGGFLQFSISHPCFSPAYRKNIKDESGRTYAIEVARYFEKINGAVEERFFQNVPDQLIKKTPKFKIPRFTYTLSEWLNAVINVGFAIELVNEPKPTEAEVVLHPVLSGNLSVAYFLHIRCRK